MRLVSRTARRKHREALSTADEIKNVFAELNAELVALEEERLARLEEGLRRLFSEEENGRGMSRSVHRYVDFTISWDPETEINRAVTCVSGDLSDCGASSGWLGTEDEIVDWMTRHTRDTRHLRYSRTMQDIAVMLPPGGMPKGVTHTLPDGWVPPGGAGA
ncbi:hypothetical protein [Streptomyces palmae]|uniref:DUF7848 domain-containing protein n=1 Tax=Streptomyces palmae TaxID=1701085 RepID=A0A4Z0HHP2_9ACTN|nr:hypothetical protein [Streptomyces palmae]TGB16473.1 hypothetical protein E4099_05370 [Streptomyces palmae]